MGANREKREHLIAELDFSCTGRLYESATQLRGLGKCLLKNQLSALPGVNVHYLGSSSR